MWFGAGAQLGLAFGAGLELGGEGEDPPTLGGGARPQRPAKAAFVLLDHRTFWRCYLRREMRPDGKGVGGDVHLGHARFHRPHWMGAVEWGPQVGVSEHTWGSSP